MITHRFCSKEVDDLLSSSVSKYKVCSSSPTSFSPDSLIILLIFAAIWINHIHTRSLQLLRFLFYFILFFFHLVQSMEHFQIRSQHNWNSENFSQHTSTWKDSLSICSLYCGNSWTIFCKSRVDSSLPPLHTKTKTIVIKF